ncbi:E3 ubiquitin-protein ligase PUB23 [Vitis vinifera]|uniref:U-box domain-containing protein n=1 Tax=Vitis vinifera TaxID=29760 RepID=A0A438GLZ5_VITVI|nr:E3 ubiquitin-protein ligase PUB23 [Vitis vinifera]
MFLSIFPLPDFFGDYERSGDGVNGYNVRSGEHRKVAWCTLHASNGVERIPTPKIPINKIQIVKLLNDAKSPQLQMKCIGKLRALAAESDANKRCIESAGAVEFLASIVSKANFTTFEEESDKGLESRSASSEALSILHYLLLSEAGLKKLVGKNGEFVGCLVRVLQRGNYESRAYAVMLLSSMLQVADPIQLIALKPEFFVEAVQVLQDHISHQATKATLKLLIEVCPWGRNKVKAVEAGAVSILTELLLASSEKRACEMILTVLDQLCGCAEGRAELLKHAAGMAIVSKKILRVSHVASERAVKILYSISKFSATPSVLQEMSQLGVVAKLCLVVQVDCGAGPRRKPEISSDCMPGHGRTLHAYPPICFLHIHRPTERTWQIHSFLFSPFCVHN